jgi:type VI secretion system protein ImpG
MLDGVSEDPHVERLMQSFAFLGARINKKLEDDYPEFTEALLDVLYPHYLRPFPSCSIAQFVYSFDKKNTPTTIPRGTRLNSHEIQQVQCRFKTAYDLTLTPVQITKAAFSPVVMAPAAAKLPSNATGCISMTFQCLGEELSFDQLQLDKLRLYINGEPSFVAALRDCLFLKTAAVFVEINDSDSWLTTPAFPLREVGFADNEALITYPERSHPAYRLVAEHFAFPEKFNFVDIDLQALSKLISGAQKITLHLVMHHVCADSNTARMLESLSTTHLRLGCTPIINLFEQAGEPINLTHTATAYTVAANEHHKSAYEVYSINSVNLVRTTGKEKEIIPFRPFYSLRHGETPEAGGHYWMARRNDLVALDSPGFETEISLVECDLNLIASQKDTLSLELTCTNRDLPTQLAFGLPKGDLTQADGRDKQKIQLLKKPTRSLHFERGRAMQWRLISHLSLNHLSLTQNGLPAIKEMLQLYNLASTAVSARQIDGLVALGHKPTMQWMEGKPHASFVRGLEIRLTIDEDYFVGSSLHGFIRVLDHFFGLYVHVNNFTQLVIISNRTSEELCRCPPRSGDAFLV